MVVKSKVTSGHTRYSFSRISDNFVKIATWAVEMDSNGSNYRTDFDASYGAFGGTNNKNDLKLKISKLEAYSRQLCLNLIDLQKNREDITNKTLALSEELEYPRSLTDEDDASSDADIRVLLHAKKSGCCAICKGYEGWEVASLDDSGPEETRNLLEPVKISSLEEPDGCSCCVCCENRISYDCDGFNSFETISRANSLTNSFALSCRLTGDIEMPYFGGSFRICKCERDGDTEERFRGGMDCSETASHYLDHDSTCIVEIERGGRSRESFASGCARNLCDFQSAWPSWDAQSKSVDQFAITSATDEEDLQTLASDDDHAELKQDGTSVPFAEAPNDKTTSTEALQVSKNKSALMQCRIEDDCKTKSNIFNPPELLRYLEAIGEMSQRAKNDGATVEDKTSNKDLLTGLTVLFLVVLAFVSRDSTFNSLLHFPNSFSTYVLRNFHRLGDFIAVGNFGTSVNFVAKLSTLVGAALVSMSLVKTTASLAARLYSFPQKLFVISAHRPLGKFYKPIKRSARIIFFFAKSQYHFFSYFAWLVFGFLMGKVSQMSDKWFLPSSRISDNDNDVVGREINLP